MADSLETTSAIDLVERVALAIYERHRAFNWPGHLADDGTRVYLNMPLPIEACEKLAEAAIEAMQPADTITRLQAALKAVKAYYIDANPTKLTEAYVCDLVCDAISGRGVTP